jgi:phosphoribosylamine---glycine ligase
MAKKFLFVSLESLSGDLAWQVKKEGCEVKSYVESKSDRDVYEGFIERVDSWENLTEWADVIVFDDVEFGEAAEKLRKKGKLVVGGSIYTDKLEIDREFGQSELKKHGISILPNWNFSDYEEAQKFLEKNPDRYVFKPSGNTPSGGKGLLFIGQEDDGKDLLELIDQNKKVWKKKAPNFQLQKFVSGVEMAIGAYFNGKNFIRPINVNFEHKRVFPGNIGPFTGEMGTLMFWAQNSPLFDQTLGRMEQTLSESGYVGYIDLNCIVNGRGVYPLEFTSRFGYPTIHIQCEGIQMPASEWLERLANGESFDLKTKKGYQIGVRVLVPSHFSKTDNEDTEFYRDMAVNFRKAGNLDGVHIEDVKCDNGIWRIAGSSGCVLVITASGSTVEETRRLVYSRIQNVMIPNMFYRTDIGTRWFEESDKLRTWGYL